MAETLAGQLATLMRERDRLEQFLMLDANWRALRQLDAREAAGEPLQAVDGTELRAKLEAVLGANRLYAARAKIIEAIELLIGTRPLVVPQASESAGIDAGAKDWGTKEPGSGDSVLPVAARETALPGIRPRTISSRIVLLKDTLQVAPGQAPPLVSAPVRAEPSLAEIAEAIGSLAAAAAPDDLTLIAGLDDIAVERLRAAGVTSFAAIAGWTAAETRDWRMRLAGAASGPASGWIEQAAMLAAGRDTYHAARVKRGEAACLASPPGPLSQRLPLVPAVPVDVPVARQEILVPPPAFVPALAAPATVVAADEVQVEDEPASDETVVETSPPAAGPDPVAVEPEAASPKRIIVIDAEEPFAELGSDEPDASLVDASRTDFPSAPQPAYLAASLAEPPAQRWKRAFDRRARLRTIAARAQPVDGWPGSAEEMVAAVEITPAAQALQLPPEQQPEPEPSDEPSDENAAMTDASLMRRLQRAKAPDSFNRHEYAAYYDAVEEASVSIVRPVGVSGGSSGSGQPAARQAQPVPEQRTNRVNRFLRALTGRGD